MALTKKYRILISLIVILLGGTLVYFSWSKQKPEPASSQRQQTKPEAVKEIVIPSSLDPKDIILPFDPHFPYFEWKSKKENPYVEEFWEEYFGTSFSGKGLIKYATAMWLEKWTKRDGTEVHQISEEVPYILSLYAFKYEKPEFAQEDYNKISINQEFKTFTLKTIKLKTKIGLPPKMEELVLSHIKSERTCQYFLHSNNFIIYAFGLKEAAEDVMIRVIEQYTVK